MVRAWVTCPSAKATRSRASSPTRSNPRRTARASLPSSSASSSRTDNPTRPTGGTTTRTAASVEIPIGEQNTFEPTSANGPGKPPTTFLDGHQVGAFTTDFDLSGGKSLVWHLTGADVTASTGSKPCKATIEVRKVTVPSNDPGRFNLFINNAKVASGGHGTTSGHLRIGAGEGTVRETAEPGTTLGDYTSKVECSERHRDRLGPGHQARRHDREGRQRRLHLHEHAQGNAARTAAAAAADAARPRPAPGAPDAAGACTSARPRRDQVGRARDRRRRQAAHLDDDRDQPVVRRGGRRQRREGRRSAFVPDTADLAPRRPGHVPAVHLRPRSPRPRRLGDSDRRHRGDAGGRRRRHRPGQLRGAGVELPQQRRGRDRPGRRPTRPSRRSEPLCHADRRSRGSCRTGDRRSSASRRGTVGAGHLQVSGARARPGCGRDRDDRPPGHRALNRPAETLGLFFFTGLPRARTGGGSTAGHSSASSARPTRASRADAPLYGTMSIGVPSGASRRSRRATSFATRTQPCETACPSNSGWFVPWMPTTSRRPVGDPGVGARLERERPEERIGRARTRTGRRSRGRAGSPCPRRRPPPCVRGAACRREPAGPRACGRRAGRRSCSPPDAPRPRLREPSRGRRSAGPAGSAGTRAPRPGRGGMPGRARSGTGGRAGTAASGARSERRAPAPSGRRPPASARRPPGTPSWARVGRRPPRQQTRTPSRARPLRRMRGADRPPRHDSFGRAAALPGGRWGEGAGGAAPSPPRTGGRPLFRLYPGRSTERPKLAPSRPESLDRGIGRAWTIGQRHGDRRDGYSVGASWGDVAQGGLAETDPRRGARVSARVGPARRARPPISRLRQRRGRPRSPRTLSQCASGRRPWPGNGASRRPGSRSRAREHLAASWCPSRRH